MESSVVINRRVLRLEVKRANLVSLLAVLSIIVPTLPLTNTFSFRIEDIFAFLTLILVLGKFKLQLTRFDIVLGLMVIFTLGSIVWGYLFLDVSFESRDFFELMKILRIWTYFHIAIFYWNENGVRGFWSIVLLSNVFAAIIGILQSINPAGLGLLTANFYGKTSAHLGEISERVIGTGTDPNQFALMMNTALAIAISAFYWIRRKILLLLCVVLFIVAILFTESRSGFIGIISILIVNSLLITFRSPKVRTRLVYLFVLILFSVFILIPILISLMAKFMAVQRMSTEDKILFSQKGRFQSYIVRFTSQEEFKRINIWEYHLNLVKSSPVFGWGPAKGANLDKGAEDFTAHNEYIFYLRQYGILGFIIYSFLYFQIILIGWRLIKNNLLGSWRWTLGSGLISITMVYLEVNLVLFTFSEFQIMSFFWLLVGIGYSALYIKSPQLLNEMEGKQYLV